MSSNRLLPPGELADTPMAAAVSSQTLSTEVDGGIADGESEIDWRRVLNAVSRFKWLIAAVTLLGTAGGVAATHVLKPDYTAQATIWIDQPDRGGPEKGPIQPGQLLAPQAWVDLLKSYVVLDEVVRTRHMFVTTRSPADAPLLAGLEVTDQYRPGNYRLTVDGSGLGYTLSTDSGLVLNQGRVGDSIGVALGLRWAPSPQALGASRRIDFSLTTLRDAARWLGDRLQVSVDVDGNFLRMELAGSNPVAVASTVHSIADRYVAVAADLKRQKVTELTRILAEQLDAARDNLKRAEQELETYRQRTITLPLDRPSAPSTGKAPLGAGTADNQDPVFSSFFGMQVQRDNVHQDREALERVLGHAGDSGVSAEALSVVGSVRDNVELTQALQELNSKQAQLRALRYHYTDDYPEVQRLAGQIAVLQRETIPRMSRVLAGQLAAREGELARRLEAGSRKLRAIPARAIEEARLRRAVTLAEDLYATLQKRYEEARLAEQSTVPDIRILDQAVVPQRPVRNSAQRIVLLAFAASLGLGLGAAVLLDRIDPKVRYPDQVSRELGIPILGAVPHLRTLQRPGTDRPWVPNETQEVVEALRGACLNLVYAHGGRAPLFVTITSPGPRDGKSFLAANMALTFAQGGHRTLLIDADIRRGVLHRRLNVPRRPGLSDFLRGEVPLEQIVKPTIYAGFSVIGCGTRTYNAPELLGSPAMAQLVTAQRSTYDVVLLDSPPLGAGVDPLILSALTGTLAIVFRTGYSHRDVAAAKLEVLQRLPVRVLGAILNDVPPGGVYRTYSYYLPGYEAVDEDVGTPRVPV